MILSRNEKSGFFCPVCRGTDLAFPGRSMYYDTVCRGCGTEFNIGDYTFEEFEEEVELGAGNLNWRDLNIEQVMAMAANMDPYVANAFRDYDLYRWIVDYAVYAEDNNHGNVPGNQESAEGMGDLIRVIVQDPTDIIEDLTCGDMGYTEHDLYDRLLAIHARYNRS